MKKYLLFALMTMMIACSRPYQSLSIDLFEQAISEPNVAIVDVQTPEEYMTAHIDGAINIDWKSGQFAQHAEVQLPDKAQTIAVYCIHTNRSKKAAACLDSLGYTHVIELADGFEEWMKAGKPVVTPHFCQSCGMPLTENVMGTNADGSINDEYCSYCYQAGTYTFECSMDEMIARCVEYLDLYNESTGQQLTKEEYQSKLYQYFPTLTRWQ